MTTGEAQTAFTEARRAVARGDYDTAEALLERGKAIKAGQPLGDPALFWQAQEAVKTIRAERRWSSRVDSALDGARSAALLKEISPQALRLADELHGGDYAKMIGDKHAAFVRFLRGVPLDQLGSIANKAVLSADQVLSAIEGDLSTSEAKATMITAAESLGGFTVAGALSERIRSRAASFSVVRPRTMAEAAGPDLALPFIQGSGDAYPNALRGGWYSETQAVNDESITMGLARPSINLLRFRIKMSKSLIQDAGPRLVSTFESAVALAKTAREDAAFLVGSGAGEPLGLLALQAPGVLDNKDIRVTNSGVANTISADGVLRMLYSLPAQYRRAPGFAVACNKDTLTVLRLLKDGSGRYLFNPDDYTIDGYPLAESEHMPGIAADAYPIVCGDFAGYGIVDRIDLAIVAWDDSTTAAVDQIWFDARSRLGGQPVEGYRFAALKCAV